MPEATSSDTRTHKEAFAFSEIREEFDRAFESAMHDAVRAKQVEIIPASNHLRYTHGGQWYADADGAEVTGFTHHSHEFSVRLQDILTNNIRILSIHFNDVLRAVDRGIRSMMYTTVGDAAEKAGNSISAKNYTSAADAFFAMLQKVEFGVDALGKPSTPQVHLGKEAMEKLFADLKAKGPVFEDRVEQLVKEKREAAAERERLRQARFKRVQ